MAGLLSPGQAHEALATARRILFTLQQHRRLCAPAPHHRLMHVVVSNLTRKSLSIPHCLHLCYLTYHVLALIEVI